MKRTYPILDLNHPMFHEIPDEFREGTNTYDLAEYNLGVRIPNTHCNQCDYPNRYTERVLDFARSICESCSLERLYDSMMKHNMADCDCTGECKEICLSLYEDFEEYYKEVLNEIV